VAARYGAVEVLQGKRRGRWEVVVVVGEVMVV